MSMLTTCPNCNETLSYPEESNGHPGDAICPKCDWTPLDEEMYEDCAIEMIDNYIESGQQGGMESMIKDKAEALGINAEYLSEIVERTLNS